MAQLRPLWPHQEKSLAALRASLASGRKRPVLQLSTGAGKTVISAHILHSALAKRKRIAFTVPMLNLVDQSFERFVENGIDAGDIGIMQGDHSWRRAHAPVQICSVQTIDRRGFPEVDLVIVDEAHLQFKAIKTWMLENPNLVFIGLSATPWARGMAETWDDLIIPTTLTQLVDEGFLSKFRVFAPSHPDLSGVKIVAGDFHEGQLSERMSDKTLVADVVQNGLEKADDAQTLVFAVDRAHAAVLHDEFESVGVKSAYVDGETPREERTALAARFQARDIRVIVSIGTMTTGVDLDVRCIVYARPTKSEMLYVQSIGRGLRTAPGKEMLTVFDHSDTTLRLGLPTEIHHAKLLSGKPTEKEIKERAESKPATPRECSSCSSLVPAGMGTCPHCGWKPERVSQIETVEGELVELGAEKAKRKANKDWDWNDKATFYAELKGYIEERGMKPGFAAAKYKEKMGVWPNDPRVKDVAPAYCGMTTRSWIRSRQIAFAKSKKAGTGSSDMARSA
jgi:DNA repair protein RadD